MASIGEAFSFFNNVPTEAKLNKQANKKMVNILHSEGPFYPLDGALHHH